MVGGEVDLFVVQEVVLRQHEMDVACGWLQ